MRVFVLLASLLPATVAAADFYQCVDESGRKTFSQLPCGDDATKRSIESPKDMGSVVPDAEETDRVKKSNRVYQIDQEIRGKLRKIDALTDKMNGELQHLREQRRYAENNLAGAQWEESLATEMQAVTSKYSTQIEFLQSELDALRAERRRLQGS